MARLLLRTRRKSGSHVSRGIKYAQYIATSFYKPLFFPFLILTHLPWCINDLHWLSHGFSPMISLNHNTAKFHSLATNKRCLYITSCMSFRNRIFGGYSRIRVFFLNRIYIYFW